MATLFFSRKSESGKSACCVLVSGSQAFSYASESRGEVVYTPAAPWGESPAKGQSQQIPDNFEVIPWADEETGVVRTNKEGKELMILKFV